MRALALTTGLGLSGWAAAEAPLPVADQTHVVATAARMGSDAGHFDAIRPVGKVAIARRGDCRHLIDAAGKLLTSTCYAEMWPLEDEDAALFGVRIEGGDRKLRAGVIDAQGRTVLEPRWDRFERNTLTRNGRDIAYFVVTRDGRSGSFDAAGKEIFPPRFDRADRRDYHDPLYRVAEGKLEGLCDLSRGTCPIPVQYRELRQIDDPFLDDQLYVAQLGNKRGVITVANVTVIPFDYDRIRMLERNTMGPTDLEAHQGFVATRFRLARDDGKQWHARTTPGPVIGDQPYDLNLQALKEKPVLDARYLPDGMLTEAEVLAAARAGRLREAVFPSIQIADRRAFVNFGQFAHAGKAMQAPAMTVCREADGFSLLPKTDADDDGNAACARGGSRALHFRNDGAAALQCADCARQGLPTHWRLAAAAPRNACTAAGSDWSAAAARRDYADWLGRFEHDAPKWLAPEGDSRRSKEGTVDELESSVATNSRAVSMLAALSLDPQRMADQLDGIPAGVPWPSLGMRLMALLKNVEPAGYGGVYPESDDRYAHTCSEVWYVKLPGLDAATAAAKVPGIEKYALPPAGEFRRRAYPFLIFARDRHGMCLAGISREFLQAWLWLDFGRKP
jgi:hypothetical protein